VAVRKRHQDDPLAAKLGSFWRAGERKIGTNLGSSLNRAFQLITITTGNFGTSGAFDYTKIGRVVHLRGYIYAGSSIADTSAIWQFAGLPFAPSHETYGTVVFYAVNVPGDSLWCNSYCHPSGYVRLYSTRDNAINDWLQWSDVLNDHVDFNLTYITAA
jgi:hypothetical protein